MNRPNPIAPAGRITPPASTLSGRDLSGNESHADRLRCAARDWRRLRDAGRSGEAEQARQTAYTLAPSLDAARRALDEAAQ